MRATVWGARGSVPAPGPATMRYGGNTSCVQLELSDGSTLVLDGHDMLFGYPALLPGPRCDHELLIDEHSTLLLYSDGLVERRGFEVDEGIAEVRALLADLRDASPQEIVDTVVQARTGGAPHDDVVALAVRFCRS